MAEQKTTRTIAAIIKQSVNGGDNVVHPSLALKPENIIAMVEQQA